MQNKSTRYYIADNGNSRSLIDGTTGVIVSDEQLWLNANETGNDRETRFEAQKLECERLNAVDFASRRQFGESRAAFAARTQ